MQLYLACTVRPHGILKVKKALVKSVYCVLGVRRWRSVRPVWKIANMSVCSPTWNISAPTRRIFMKLDI